MNAPESYNATVIEKRLLSPSMMLFRITPDKEIVLPSGSYLHLGLAKEAPWIQSSSPPLFAPSESKEIIRRPYFPTSSMDNTLYIEFLIHIVRSGELSPRLFRLERGDRLYISENPRIHFSIENVSDEKDLILIATGSAIAPYISIIRNEVGKVTHRKFIIIHAARFAWDLVFRDELSMLSQISDLFQYIPIVLDNEKDLTWQGLTGTIEENFISGKIETIIQTSLIADKCDCFLSGSPQMTGKMADYLQKRGFQKGQSIHYETMD